MPGERHRLPSTLGHGLARHRSHSCVHYDMSAHAHFGGYVHGLCFVFASQSFRLLVHCDQHAYGTADHYQQQDKHGDHRTDLLYF